MYKDEEFLVRFAGCEMDDARNCEREMDAYYVRWESAVAKAT